MGNHHQYKLLDKVTADAYVFIEVKKAMYGLPWTGLIAQESLKEWLNKRNTHKARLYLALGQIQNELVIDNFLIKFVE